MIMSRDKQRRDPPAAEPLRAPRQPGLRRTAGQLEELPLPVPRLDLRQHRRAARLSVQRRLRRADAKKELGLGAGRRASQPTAASSSAASPRTARSLAEHLGAAAEAIDRLCALARGRGRDHGRAGSSTRCKANWKMLVENETDGYHPQFVHSSIFERRRRAASASSTARSRRRSRRDLGDGHTENRPAARVPAHRHSRWAGSGPRGPACRTTSRSMQQASRRGRRAQIMIDGSPHVMIFPNLFIAEIQIFVLQPLAVDETVQHVTALQFKGAPDLNERMLRQTDRLGRPRRLPARRRLRDVRAQPARRAGAQPRVAARSPAACTASARDDERLPDRATPPTRCPAQHLARTTAS